jgi:hypothetical protein
MKAKLDSSQEEIKSKLDVCLEKNETWLELYVTDLKDSQDEDPEAVMEWYQISNDEAIVQTIRALEDRYGDRHLAVERSNSRRNISRTMVGPLINWPPSASECHPVPFLHGVRNAVIEDRRSRRGDETVRNSTVK